MRKPGQEGAPTASAFRESAKTAHHKHGGPSLAIGRGEKLPASKGAGLTAKGRAKYNRETGSHLKAPQPQGGARRDSFCARMKGMKAKLTSAKTAHDPNSRINLALKKWDVKC